MRRATWAANWALRNRCAARPVEARVAADVTRIEYPSCADAAAVTLYRGMAWDGRPTHRRPRSLESATFSRELAEDHFGGGPTTTSAALYRQEVPTERVLMTFVETRAMNLQFKEAEAVLLGAGRRDLF